MEEEEVLTPDLQPWGSHHPAMVPLAAVGQQEAEAAPSLACKLSRGDALVRFAR